MPITLIFSKKQEFSKKLSDYLVFCRNILIDRQLVVWRLSGNCLDGLLMKGIVRCEELSDDRNCQLKEMSAVGM